MPFTTGEVKETKQAVYYYFVKCSKKEIEEILGICSPLPFNDSCPLCGGHPNDSDQMNKCNFAVIKRFSTHFEAICPKFNLKKIVEVSYSNTPCIEMCSQIKGCLHFQITGPA